MPEEYDPIGTHWVPITLVENNQKKRVPPNTVTSVDTDLFKGIFCGLVRPSHNPEFEMMNYMSKPCFEGRKRLWELRLQGEFKKEIVGREMWTGIVLDNYVPVNFTIRWTAKILHPLLKKTMGLNGNEVVF